MPERPSSPRAGSFPPCAEARAIRVVLADDSVLFREGLARVLAERGFLIVGQAGDADTLHDVVGQAEPNVVVTDIRMPPTNTNDGLLAAQRIRAEHSRPTSSAFRAMRTTFLMRWASVGVSRLTGSRVASLTEKIPNSIARPLCGTGLCRPR